MKMTMADKSWNDNGDSEILIISVVKIVGSLVTHVHLIH